MDSTAILERIGDAGWRDLLAKHQEAIQLELDRHRGREMDRAGDGLLALFDLASRIAALAEPGEVFVSTTTHELVAGSGLSFTSRGKRQLKGISQERELFALTPSG